MTNKEFINILDRHSISRDDLIENHIVSISLYYKILKGKEEVSNKIASHLRLYVDLLEIKKDLESYKRLSERKLLV